MSESNSAGVNGGNDARRSFGNSFRGYRGGNYNQNRFGRGRFYKKPNNGLGPNFSRFDDDLSLNQTSEVLDMTPVAGIATKNVYWEWCEQQKAAYKPEEPFKFEPPETDFHLQSTRLLKELREEREKGAVKDIRGNLMLDCLGAHGPGDMCQFCDGRRGKWYSKPSKPDPAFQRYQNSIIASMPWSSSSAQNRPSNNQPNTLQLAPVDDPEEVAALFDDDAVAFTTDNRSLFG